MEMRLSVQCWRLPPASSALPGSTGAREPPGSSFPLFFFLPFFWNSVQHKRRGDPRGFAAIQRGWLILCQTLRWGQAGGNPFCSVFAGLLPAATRGASLARLVPLPQQHQKAQPGAVRARICPARPQLAPCFTADLLFVHPEEPPARPAGSSRAVT